MFKHHQAHSPGGDGPSDQAAPYGARHRVSSRGYSSPQIKGATEEETLGLVKGDSKSSKSMPALHRYSDSDDDFSAEYHDDKQSRYGHSITKGYTHSPPRRVSNEKDAEQDEPSTYGRQRQPLNERSRSDEDDQPPPPPPHGGRGGAFV